MFSTGRVAHFSTGERLTLTWLVITGVIHMIVEGEICFWQLWT